MMTTDPLRILFFGSSEYTLPLLELLSKHFKLVGILTQPDKPVGRKQTLTSSPPKKFAITHNIPVFTPKDKTELINLQPFDGVYPEQSRGAQGKPTTYNLQLTTNHLQPDIAVVADYGLIIPKKIFEMPKLKTINIHFSKLPRLRGASPVQYTILLGEKSAWITIQLLDETLDTGDILWQKEFPLSSNETTGSLYPALFREAALHLPGVIKGYIKGELQPQEQDHTKATYTRRITKADGFIPFELLKLIMQGNNPTEKQLESLPLTKILPLQLHASRFTLHIERAIRAFSPWPGVWTVLSPTTYNLPARNASHSDAGGQPTTLSEKRMKILKAHLEPTTYLPAMLRIAMQAGNQQPFYPAKLQRSGATKLVLDTVQLEGKNPVSWRQFQEAYPQSVPLKNTQEA